MSINTPGSLIICKFINLSGLWPGGASPGNMTPTYQPHISQGHECEQKEEKQGCMLERPEAGELDSLRV